MICLSMPAVFRVYTLRRSNSSDGVGEAWVPLLWTEEALHDDDTKAAVKAVGQRLVP